MKTALLIFSILAAVCLVLAQPPDTLWTRDYPDLVRASATGVVPSFDGGLVWVGRQEFLPADTFATFFPKDLIVMQTDAVGNPEWTFRLTSADTTYEGLAICRTLDSAYLVLGQRTYGDTLSDAVLVKLNRQGEQIWLRNYFYFQNAWARALCLLSNGTALASMQGQIFDPNDPICTNYPFLMNVDLTTGDTLWTQTWTSTQCEKFINVLTPTSDGGCLIYAVDCPPRPQDPCNPLVIKIDETGHVQWNRMDEATFEYGRGATVEVSDGYVVSRRFHLILQLEKLDFIGQTQWIQSYEAETQRIESPKGIVQTADGGFLIGGEAQLAPVWRRAPVLIKTDAVGNRQWQLTADLPSSNNILGFCRTPEGNIVFAGNSYAPMSYDPGYVWMIEYGWSSAASAEESTIPKAVELCPNYPNPFNPTTEIGFELPRTMPIEITVFDLTGRRVATLANGMIGAGRHTVRFDGSNLPSGMYVCRMQTPENSLAQKMVLLK